MNMFNDWPDDLTADLDEEVRVEIRRTFAAAVLDAADTWEISGDLVAETRFSLEYGADETEAKARLIAALLIHEVHYADLLGRAHLFVSALDEGDGDLRTVDGIIVRAHLVMGTTTTQPEGSAT